MSETNEISEEQRKKPTTITREELYRQVWQTAMFRLGEQYGISGNGLKKICDRLNVPYPPRGYWAKRAAGKFVKQARLPKRQSDTPTEVRITPTPTAVASPTPEIAPETAEELRVAKDKTAGIAVPAKLRSPHAAIAAWIISHEREAADARRSRSLWGTAYQAKPFTSLERRQQRILSTLFKEPEKLGYKIKGEAPHRLSLEIGRNEVEFTLHERIKQIRRLLTDEEKAEGYSSKQKWRLERIATGELVFTINTYLDPGLKQDWRDGEQPLEDQIGDIIAVLAIAGPILEKQRRGLEEVQRRRREEEARRYEEKEKQDQDHNRWRRFIEFAELWREAQLAGDFIKVLERQSAHPDALYDGKSAADWLSWARERRSRFDSSRLHVSDLWSDLACVTAWGHGGRH